MGLIWTKDAQQIPEQMNWYEGVEACNDLDFAGYDDWRLPNIKELLSLIDYSQDAPALTAGHPFTNVQSAHYWSSTMSAGGGTVWSVYLGGGVGTFGTSHPSYVWPVRGGKYTIW